MEVRATTWVGWVVGVGRAWALALGLSALGAAVVPGDRASVVTDAAWEAWTAVVDVAAACGDERLDPT